jgi:hypothetical protein
VAIPLQETSDIVFDATLILATRSDESTSHIYGMTCSSCTSTQCDTGNNTREGRNLRLAWQVTPAQPRLMDWLIIRYISKTIGAQVNLVMANLRRQGSECGEGRQTEIDLQGVSNRVYIKYLGHRRPLMAHVYNCHANNRVEPSNSTRLANLVKMVHGWFRSLVYENGDDKNLLKWMASRLARHNLQDYDDDIDTIKGKRHLSIRFLSHNLVEIERGGNFYAL